MELQWPLIIFTTFIAWSAGTFAAQGIFAIRGHETKAQMPALITSFAIMVIAGVACFFHLQHWERIFNGFGHLSSGITQELIGVILMGIVMVVMFALIRRGGGRKVPAWCGILAVVIAVALVAVMGHSYMMASRPVWDSVLQICSLLGASCVLGPATFAAVVKIADPACDVDFSTLIVGGAAVNVVTTAAYLVAMGLAAGEYTSIGYYYDPTQIVRGMIDFEAVSGLFAGWHLGLTIAIVLCALLPLVLALVSKQGGIALGGKGDGAMRRIGVKEIAIAIVVLGVVGALVLRVLFYDLGLSVFMFYFA